MQVNAVFEGGGVKAIGLVGAIKAAEERGIRFQKMAGTSSGSIVAALLSAGYSADEIKQIIMETPFTSFLEKTPFSIRWVGPAIRLFVKKGLYSGQSLEQWIRKLLLNKGIRTFADLKPGQLRIIASDISDGRLLVLPDDIKHYGFDPQKLEVSKAIRMSASIPYFFEPVILRKPAGAGPNGVLIKARFVYIVDGGLLSNFPLWVFDRESEGVKNQQTIPTIGFQLVGKHTNVPRTILGPLTMFHALFATMMEAHDERYIEEHNSFRTIKIPTLGVQTTEFDISAEKSMMLFDSGLKAANKFFNKWSYSSYMHQYEQWVTEKDEQRKS